MRTVIAISSHNDIELVDDNRLVITIEGIAVCNIERAKVSTFVNVTTLTLPTWHWESGISYIYDEP